MFSDNRLNLSNFVTGLLSTGRIVFTAEEAEKTLNVEHGAFLDAAERLQRRRRLLKLRQGFYVIVPPQYLSWGAPPPSWYIDALMRNEDQTNSYYVGLLKAAELHGATHQAVMEFQIVTAKRLPVILAGRSRVVFYYRKDIGKVMEGIIGHKTDTGEMKISSAALTALDLLRYPQASGGIDNIATILSDLGHKIESTQLATLSGVVERPVVQRLGYLLDSLGYDELNKPMLKALHARGSLTWTELERHAGRARAIAPKPRLRDFRWRIVVRRTPQVDT